METVWQWGLSVIVGVQELRSPLLDAVMRGLTFMGDEQFFLLFLPLLLWSVDAALAARLAVILLISIVVNGVVKDALMQPRPAALDPALALATAEGYGLPSGHTQSAVVIWGSIAAWTRQRWVKVAAFTLAALIGLSRVYLGVHFPTDVAAGWLIGAVLLILYRRALPGILRFATALPTAVQIAAIVGIPALIAALYPSKDSVGAMGALAGVGLGLFLAARNMGVAVDSSVARRALRFIVAAPVALLIYASLRAILPGETSAWYLPFRFARYGAVGLWLGLGAPWLFALLRLRPRAAR